jgi:uncharacterized lipoprotein YmbA
MKGFVRILRYTLYILMILAMVSCASSKKNTYYAKKKKSSRVSTSQLGRNKYYFSPGYQKKLYRSYKKK